ncbi:MAG TPA: hypothetical protein PKV95_10765, partial [Anaerolineaceae bacterium]|nr:hypothetical protein [Anaerolineaceae bacterium]
EPAHLMLDASPLRADRGVLCRPTPHVIARRSRSNPGDFQKWIATPPAGARNDRFTHPPQYLTAFRE